MSTNIRIDYGQRRAVDAALEAALNFMAPADTLEPAWLELHAVDVPDTHLLAVRFPSRCMLPADEENPEPWAAIGVYVALVDRAGDVVHLTHSAGGTLPTHHHDVDREQRRGGTAIQS